MLGENDQLSPYSESPLINSLFTLVELKKPKKISQIYLNSQTLKEIKNTEEIELCVGGVDDIQIKEQKD